MSRFVALCLLLLAVPAQAEISSQIVSVTPTSMNSIHRYPSWFRLNLLGGSSVHDLNLNSGPKGYDNGGELAYRGFNGALLMAVGPRWLSLETGAMYFAAPTVV